MTREEATVTETQSQDGAPDQFVGYQAAADYLGLARNTVSSYVARGIGPEALPETRPHGQYNLPVFTRESLDTWLKGRPGQGARTDLVAVTT